MNLLFVCSGNTCRSPMAAALLNAQKRPDYRARSAGFGPGGQPANPTAQEVMLDRGIDLSSHRSRPVDAAQIAWADRIVCMSREHKALLVAMGVAEDKIDVLDIPDPFGQSRDVYALCRDQLLSRLVARFGLTPRVVCRPATQDDIPALAQLERECFNEPWSPASLAAFAEHNGRLYLAEQNGKTVGYAGVSVIADEGYLANVAVTVSARRQGVGQALMTALTTDAVREKLLFLTLEVRPSNTAALALYHAFGFKEAGRRKDFYRAPTEDALILTRRFRYDHFEY